MINPFADIDWRPGLAKRREFGRVLALVFGGLAIALAISTHARWLEVGRGALVALASGASLGAVCWVFPQIALPLYRVWYAVGAVIGMVISNLLLALTYYMVLTPIALILRLAGRDPLHRAIERDRVSYWEPAEPSTDSERYFRQF
jgi:hypothetical protein